MSFLEARQVAQQLPWQPPVGWNALTRHRGNRLPGYNKPVHKASKKTLRRPMPEEPAHVTCQQHLGVLLRGDPTNEGAGNQQATILPRHFEFGTRHSWLKPEYFQDSEPAKLWLPPSCLSCLISPPGYRICLTVADGSKRLYLYLHKSAYAQLNSTPTRQHRPPACVNKQQCCSCRYSNHTALWALRGAPCLTPDFRMS